MCIHFITSTKVPLNMHAPQHHAPSVCCLLDNIRRTFRQAIKSRSQMSTNLHWDHRGIDNPYICSAVDPELRVDHSP